MVGEKAVLDQGAPLGSSFSRKFKLRLWHVHFDCADSHKVGCSLVYELRILSVISHVCSFLGDPCMILYRPVTRYCEDPARSSLRGPCVRSL